MTLSIISALAICGCNSTASTQAKKSTKTEVDVDGGNDTKLSENNSTRDVRIPEHDYALDEQIVERISSIADPKSVYKIHQFESHHLVHILDKQDQSKTGIVFTSKDLKQANYVKIKDRNPYHVDLPSDTSYLGLPVYDVSGMTKQEIEAKVPNVKWDNKGKPTHIYTRSIGSNFAATNMAKGYNLNIIGTEGPMSVQSKLYIENKEGNKIDSIEFIGSEIWHPTITDDGRFTAFLYGRSFPKEGGGKITQHLAIYDLQEGKTIFEIKDFDHDGSKIGAGGNFFHFRKTIEGIKLYHVIDPHLQKIYKIDRQKLKGAKAFKHDGVYGHPDDPSSLKLLSWEDDFETIIFSNYKH